MASETVCTFFTYVTFFSKSKSMTFSLSFLSCCTHVFSDTAITVAVRFVTNPQDRKRVHYKGTAMELPAVEVPGLLSAARTVCRAGFIKRSSVHPSVLSIDRPRGGFAAKRPAGRRYRSIAAMHRRSAAVPLAVRHGAQREMRRHYCCTSTAGIRGSTQSG